MLDQMLAQTFVDLADTLGGHVDAVDFLHVLVSGSSRLLSTDAAGVALADAKDQLQVVAASDDRPRLQELLALQVHDGIGAEAYRRSEILTADLGTDGQRWPRFAAAAIDMGYRSACSLPLHIRDTTLGSLTVFWSSSVPLDTDQLALGRALADVAAVGLLQQRAVRQAELLADQLQQALDSRVLLEQAKGVLAERLDVDMAEAFRVLRTSARNSNTRLSDYARLVVEGRVMRSARQEPGSSPFGPGRARERGATLRPLL